MFRCCKNANFYCAKLVEKSYQQTQNCIFRKKCARPFSLYITATVWINNVLRLHQNISPLYQHLQSENLTAYSSDAFKYNAYKIYRFNYHLESAKL